MTPLPPTCARPDAALGSLDPAQHLIWIVCPCPRNWQTLMDIRTMIAHAGGPDVRLCDLPRRMRCQALHAQDPAVHRRRDTAGNQHLDQGNGRDLPVDRAARSSADAKASRLGRVSCAG